MARSRLLLLGDPTARPDGLERALIRAGFTLAEAPSPTGEAFDGHHPDLALLVVGSGEATLDEQLGAMAEGSWRDIPFIVVLPEGEREGVARALAYGASDALVGPVHLPELVARTTARLRTHHDGFRHASASAVQTQLFLAFQEIALAARPQEILQLLVCRLAEVLGAAHAACVVRGEDGRGRLVAVAEQPEVRNREVNLEDYPDASHALATGRTVFVPATADHPLFAELGPGPVALVTSAVAIPLLFLGKLFGVIVLRTEGDQSGFASDQVAFAETLVAAASRILEHEERKAGIYRRQANAGLIDPLTGCGGLDALDKRLREEFQRSQRYGRRFSLVLLDIDGLREINQQVGVQGGDSVLSELGSLLLREIRSPDFVARYGGDEFALILPETDEEDARRAVERFRAAVRAHTFPDLAVNVRPAVSAGVVTYPHGSVVHADDLFALVESAVQAAKSQAGDRISVAVAA